MFGLDSSLRWVPVLLTAALLHAWPVALDGATDLNHAQLRLVADRLKLDQCRSLVESLRSSEDYALDHTPDGHAESHALSCYRLLELWNRQRPANSTFHALLVRLQELGHRDLADDLSRVVYGEKVLAVKANFLSDPFRTLSPHQDLRSRSELVKGSLDRSTGDEDQPQGGIVELVSIALALALIMLLGTFICNRLTRRCTIKIPQRSRRILRGDQLDSQESTFQLLPENV
ncbi:hypothetical protein HPB49_015900 [Dermacentor silvarum]|uniref:Uncharacterized protein n=1 Tax=Dermacentor silvarum TaxID=543639 RepID=A0ACB8DQK7_DERSI|nr:uncharacterized protein LOC125940867 [Dermacentor silvarum]KAH7974484.1 hypothetical protein HPB49_015900 [Dermacentor silvarum]